MKNITDKTKPNKWEGHPLVPITVFGIVTLIGLSLAGIFNYGINSYHITKQKIPLENISTIEMIMPYHNGRWKEKNNRDSIIDSTEFIYRK